MAHTATISADYVVGCDGPRSVVRDADRLRVRGRTRVAPELRHGLRRAWPRHPSSATGPPSSTGWSTRTRRRSGGPLDTEGTWWIILVRRRPRAGDERARAWRSSTRPSAHPVGVDGSVDRPVDRPDAARRPARGIAGCSSPATPHTSTRRSAGTASTPASATPSIWDGSCAAVLAGWGGPGLLDTYELERRPVQDRVIREATANMSVLSTELHRSATSTPQDRRRGRPPACRTPASRRPSTPSSTPSTSSSTSATTPPSSAGVTPTASRDTASRTHGWPRMHSLFD